MTEDTPEAPALAELRADPSSRKSFLRLAGAGAAGGLAALMAACGDARQTDSSTTDSGTSVAPKEGSTSPTGGASGDLAILNYALTLEHLEADFYDQVVASGLATGMVAELVREIDENEHAHVDALTEAVISMGGKAVTAPQTNFEPVLKKGLDTVLRTAATVENLGAAAYLGQAPKLQSKELLAAALSIHSVEARHAASLNQLVGRGFTGGGPLEGSIPDGPFAKPMGMSDVLEAIKPYLA